jgi:hypothetical protein
MTDFSIRRYQPKPSKPKLPETGQLTPPRPSPPPLKLYTVAVMQGAQAHSSKPLTHAEALALLESACHLFGDVMGGFLYFDTDAAHVPVGFTARDRVTMSTVATVRIVEVTS